MIVENQTSTRRPELSAAKQALLEKRLRGEARGLARTRTIPRRRPAALVPLSFAQQRLWFFNQLEPESPLYNMPTILRLSGVLEPEALAGSLNSIVARHESLRTRFASGDDGPIQVIDPPSPVRLAFVDLTKSSETVREAELKAILDRECECPFDLTRDGLLRALLVQLAPAEHVLVLNMHHIVSDGWSWSVFFRELTALYDAHRGGRSAELPELPIQYADYAVWQREWLQGEILERQLDYWKHQLAGAPDFLELPTDHLRPAVQTFRGRWESMPLSREVSAALKALSRREGVTLFMTLLAAFKTLLWRYTRQSDILVGSPIAGRNHVETEPLIGFFINTLVLRTRLGGALTFRELLQRIREVTLGAYANQDLPFEKLVEEFRPERSPSHSTLVQVIFVLQNAFGQELKLPGLEITPLESTTGTAKFDLTLSIDDRGDGLIASMEYNTDLFETATIRRALGHFQVLLEGIVADPNAKLQDLPLLTASERRQLLSEWTDTRTDYPRSKTIPELFEEQVAAAPEATAVQFEGRAWTYRELNERANQLGRHLQKLGVGPDVFVGVAMDRSFEMIVALAGILKAGGAYVSLDPAYPKERLDFMLRDARVSVLLTQTKLKDVLEARMNSAGPNSAGGQEKSVNGNPVWICLDTEWERIAQESAANPPRALTPDHLAYVSYTSGSTGRPKGVCVPHRGVVRLVKETQFARFGADEVFLQFAPVAFDASTLEIWGPLLNGGKLVVFPPYMPSLSELGEVIRSSQVTTLWLTAGLFHQMAEEQLESLTQVRQLLAGGDILSVPHVAKALERLDRTQLINGYGPTENTTFTCCHRIAAPLSANGSVPIGAPIANTHVYILDARLQPVPVGIPGELYIGGDGLARNYLNQPELTAERFVPNPFSSETGARLYRTGDLSRWLPDGSVEFLGRIDRQVKIRGFRVELEEIESNLREHGAVQECLVTISDDDSGGKRLLAYVIPRAQQTPTVSDLCRFLQAKLPDYMVPSAFGFLDALPLTPNGKVNRQALPALDALRPEMDKVYVAPRDEVERQLTRIWESVLGIQPIGVTDKFFELGGHSLLAVRMISLIEKTFGRKLRVASVFQNPTIGLLANLLRQFTPAGPSSAIVEIQPKGSKPALVLVHGVGGGMFWGYTNLARHLGTDQPVYGIKSRGQDGLDEFSTIEEMAAHYVKELRAFEPQGPYYLGGYCFGGDVAYEMARQLREQGQTVALLALMDCSAPNSSYDRVRWTPRYVFRFLGNLCSWMGNFMQLSSARRMEYIRWKARTFKKWMRRFNTPREAAGQGPDIDDLADFSTYAEDQRALWEAHIRALVAYHPRPYSGHVVLFRTRGHPLFCSFDSLNGWGEFITERPESRVVPGVHESMLEEPHVQVLASEIKICLEAVQPHHRK